ncbi:MAG: prephenate dehydrogenase/arogenate dehydrogenase family protein [Desulfobacterales bacterium]|nr:prephenate dehydrogenase/arogenate dehydrogenase family protein [Desulfobacterales bacterium]
MDRVTIGIVGGTGKMGKWFENYFSDLGHKILISGRKTSLSPFDLVKQCNIIILSTPLHAAIKTAEEIGPIMSQEQLLMDFCSLKEDIVESMMKSTSANVIGVHPIFGPSTKSIKGQNIVMCYGRGDKWMDQLENEFKAHGAIVTRMDPKTHDKNMAVVQSLTHFLTISMGSLLQKINMLPKEAICFSTPIFRIKLALIARLFAQDISLYTSLINKNNHFPEILEIFKYTIDELESNVLSDDEKGLSYLKNIQEFIGDFCKEGFDESNDILNAPFQEGNQTGYFRHRHY